MASRNVRDRVIDEFVDVLRAAKPSEAFAVGRTFLLNQRNNQPKIRDFLFRLLDVLEVLGTIPTRESVHLAFNGCNFMMEDKSVRVSGNSSAAGVNTGDSSTLWVHDVSVYLARVEQSEHMSSALRDALRDARLSIDSTLTDNQEKSDALQDLGRLTEELEKASPEPSRLKRLWEGLQWMVDKSTPFVKLASEITKLIPPST